MTDRASEMVEGWMRANLMGTGLGTLSLVEKSTIAVRYSLDDLMRSYAAEVLEKAAEEVDELPQFITKRQVVLSTLRARAAAEREGR